MCMKNVIVVKILVCVVIENGNDFGDMWIIILVCVSRYEYLYAFVSGFNDSLLFLEFGYSRDDDV